MVDLPSVIKSNSCSLGGAPTLLNYDLFDAEAPGIPGHVLASLFRPAFARALVAKRHLGIIREMGLLGIARAGATAVDFFEWAYRRLYRTYRCEYIYKNEILLMLFRSRHNLAHAVVASEFLIGNNRLDLLVVNGTTEAYEVKTRYDDLARLVAQTAAYLTVFDRVNVVCDPAYAGPVRSLVDARVGIISLTAKGSLCVERDCTPNAKNLDPESVFDLLRSAEYVDVVRRLFQVRLNVPNTQRRRAHLAYFKTLDPRAAHAVLVQSLRRRFSDRQSPLVNRLPNSLLQMYYDANVEDRGMFFEIMSQSRPLLD